MNNFITWVLQGNGNDYITFLNDNERGIINFIKKNEAINRFDLYNTRHKRNADNYNRMSYNCGGYAFDTYVWLVPYDYCEDLEVEDVILELGLSNCNSNIYNNWDSFDYTNEYVIRLMVKRILYNFKDVRIIKDLSELHTNEYGIIMRTAAEDFHFVKYDNKTNTFSHKLGCCKPEQLSIKDVFCDVWEDEYNSDMIIFAKKYNIE